MKLTRKTAKKTRNGLKKSKSCALKSRLKIPPILLEGDFPPLPRASGPGQRYALGPGIPADLLQTEPKPFELPEAYGTKQFFLTARDPHWLYASWDLTREQLREYQALSVHGHFILRTHLGAVAGRLLTEIHLPSDSRHWLWRVPQGGARYLAELGYYDPQGNWNPIAVSKPILTPAEALSEDTSVQFATVPPEITFAKLLDLVHVVVNEDVPLIEAIQQLRASGHPELPAVPVSIPAGTPAQELALAQVVALGLERRVGTGSLGIAEGMRPQPGKEIFSPEETLPASPAFVDEAIPSLSIPLGRAEPQKSFWFDINAELIIYGAAPSEAKVLVAGREIKLRPDGTFSCRFALPDGEVALPVAAVSSDLTDERAAELKFSRRTTFYRGPVGAHVPEAWRKAPPPGNVP